MKVIIVNESPGKSVLRDVVTFGSLLASFYVNHAFLGSSIILQIILGVSFFTVLIGKSSGIIKKMTPEEALKYLSENYGTVTVAVDCKKD